MSRPHLPRWVTLAALAGAVLLQSGCILTGPSEYIHNGFKVGPNYCKPPAPVAEEWIQARNADVQKRHLQDWWTVFQDAKLNSLIDTAYEQNLNLRVLGTRVLQARAQQRIAAGNLFSQRQQLQGMYLTGTGNGHRTWFNFTGFNLSWEIDFWGRIRRGIESANASLDASVENYDDALVTLLADAATNYVQYRIAQQRIKIARDNLRTQERLLAVAEQQFKVGTGTALDVEQLRTLVEQTRATIPALQIALGQANDTLCTLLGIPPRNLEPELGTGPELGDSPMPSTPNWVAAGIPADLLRRRPDVRSAERQVAAQSAQIGVAEADLYPTLAVNSILGYDTINLLGLPSSGGFLGLFYPSFTWKILNYGRILNNVRSQTARLQELIATYQNRVLTAAREVQTPLRGFLRSREQAEDLARSVAAAVAATKIQENNFRVLKADVNRLFTLENSKLQQQDNLAVAQGNIALNLINVYRALGGGWELRCQKDHGHEALPIASAVQEKTPDSAAQEELPKPKALPRDKEEK
ncbi:MAG TPA: efflux transporter outer membrane subunit [Gemmataceae bacterium]|jgi:NodT family efflux transporter outer membrane factor (OMF) lipoprotein